MNYNADGSPAFAATSTFYPAFAPPCSSALEASAPASTGSAWSDASSQVSSVWSDTASQLSDEACVNGSASDPVPCDAFCYPRDHSGAATDHGALFNCPLPRPEANPMAPGLRQNPRRTAAGSRARSSIPPALVRQSDRKVNFVDSLVDSSTQIVEAIWPISAACLTDFGNRAVLPLRTFIQETLRRSRTSYSTLQVALYYLILIRPHVVQHNLTIQHPGGLYADRALQCGRRMFLVALILASKYLQDRNYSARAWSKISGLDAHEINQTEITFLLAVNWNLHITEDVFQRWTDIVLKHTPPSPSSPAAAAAAAAAQPLAAQQTADWKHTLVWLDPGLTNAECLFSGSQSAKSDLSVLSPRSILNFPGRGDWARTHAPMPVPNRHGAPPFMEPNPSSVYTRGRQVPALALLPTPRLTPRAGALCTPAASAAAAASSHRAVKGGAMGVAMAQATGCANAQQALDRVYHPGTSWPSGHSFHPSRRSSLAHSASTTSLPANSFSTTSLPANSFSTTSLLANSFSTTSSPESLVSDSSRTSSISSASSLASATHTIGSSSRCVVPPRFQVARFWSDKACAKPSVPSASGHYDERCLSSSPASYAAPAVKFGDATLGTSFARNKSEPGDTAPQDPECMAAKVLQNLHNHVPPGGHMPTAKTGCKRSRNASVDLLLHDNVRGVLSAPPPQAPSSSVWAINGVCPRDLMLSGPAAQFPVHAELGGPGKRVCCAVEAANGCEAINAHPAMDLRGPGIWDAILN